MLVSWCALRFAEPVPTIRFEQEGQQVGCIEGANLRKAALDAGVNPYKSLNNLNNCSGVGQCGTCVMEVPQSCSFKWVPTVLLGGMNNVGDFFLRQSTLTE